MTLSHFKDLVKDLVKEQGVKHRDLIKVIRETLLEESKNLPKIPVLYCSSYGGFGYSLQFKAFVNNDDSEEEDEDELEIANTVSIRKVEAPSGINIVHIAPWIRTRITHVQMMAPFGKHCLEQYPIVAKMMRAYHAYGLKDVFNKIAKIYVCQSRCETIGKDMEKSKDDAFLDVCNKGMVKELEMMESNRSGLEGFSDEQIGTMLEIYTYVFPEERDNKKKNWYNSPDEKRQKLNFAKGIEVYGQDHFAIWKLQGEYNIEAMRFMLVNKDAFPEVQLNAEQEEAMLLKAGLMFASSPYCQLAIDYVPQLVDWDINEYDGLESVRIL